MVVPEIGAQDRADYTEAMLSPRIEGPESTGYSDIIRRPSRLPGS
jgi:hypothetical protein